jgi:hypothetical protein
MLKLCSKNSSGNLGPLKQQQWTITNYGVLILAAVYAVRLPGVPHSQSWLRGLAILTAIAGSCLLLRVQYNMAGTRCRLDEVHKAYFTPDELRGVGATDDLGFEVPHMIRRCLSELSMKLFGQAKAEPLAFHAHKASDSRSKGQADNQADNGGNGDGHGEMGHAEC